jgi:hypothetical protein
MFVLAAPQKGKDCMSSLQNVSAEDLAKLFHHYHEALAHDFHGRMSREATWSWDQAPPSEQKLMIAAARLTLMELNTAHEEKPAQRPYFAKPGEAEWGC